MSKDELLLAIDAGSGGGRAVVFSSKGELKARAYRQWASYCPAGMELYCQEFDPLDYWRLICECTKEVLSQVDRSSICAVSSTSMREGCVFLDKEGNHLYAGPNRDVRGIIYSVEMEELLGADRAHSITGHWPPWMFVPSRLFWFKKEREDIYDRIHKILMINDWILYMLCGEAVCEPSNACETMLFDVEKRRWSEELLLLAGVSKEWLPRVGKPGEVIGKVSRKAQDETGIPEGTKVVVGGADSQSAVLACGQTGPKELCVIAGTTMPVMMSIDKPFFDSTHKLWTDCHMLDDLWIIESQGGDAGKILRCYVEEHLGFGKVDKRELYQGLMSLAENVPAGSMGVRAFLGVMIWNLLEINPNKPASILFPYPLDSNNSSPAHIYRAILESIAYAVKGNLNQIKEVVGDEPVSFGICGGLTRLSLFNRIVASVLNRVCGVCSSLEASALGAAMAGSVGAGIYPDLRSASKAMGGYSFEVEPDPEWAEEYESSYDVWKENYDKFEKEW